MYDIDIQYGDIVTIIKITHKLDNKIIVFQVFNESTVSYTPVDNDYGEPIIITTFTQPAHNKFPISMLYIDVVASDLFPKFARVDSDTAKIITRLLTPEDKKLEQTLRLPRMLDTEIVAKILYHVDIPLKIVRFYKNNMMTGLEIADRSIAAVLE